MALLEETRRSIWHAFTALANSEEGQVPKSRLKVLTNNIGRALGNDKAEELLGDTPEDTLSFTLSFYEYFTIISPNLLESTKPVAIHASNGTYNSNNNNNIAESPPLPALTAAVAAQIDKICWMLCSANFLKSEKLQDVKTLNSDDLFKLWKIFNFLAKVEEGKEGEWAAEGGKGQKATLPLRVDVEEAHRIGSLLRQAVGFNPSEIPQIDPTEEDEGSDKYNVDFVDFVVIAWTAAKEFTADILRAGIASIYEEILNDVIKKGYMEKLGNTVTKWKKRWFRLTAKQMDYFVSDNEQQKKGTVDVSPEFKPESMPALRSHHQFRIKLRTAGKKSFDLATSDLRSKNEWTAAMQKAAVYCKKEGSYQQMELMEREQARKARRGKVSEDLFGKSQMRKQLQSREEQIERDQQEWAKDRNLLEMREMELERERLARLGVEAQLAEEAAMLEAERLRLKELEEIKAMLEKLLEEERQAKRDEEIVRKIQAQLLAEETEKREQLEYLKAQQERLLQQERQQREGLEKQSQEQIDLLERTQQQLNALALEREHADSKIREALEKMQKAEHERLRMEERLRLRQMSTSVGLRKPLAIHNPDPFVTHRGVGAFCEADFANKQISVDESQNSVEDAQISVKAQNSLEEAPEPDEDK